MDGLRCGWLVRQVGSNGMKPTNRLVCDVSYCCGCRPVLFFFFQAEDGIRDADVTGVQTCALPIYPAADIEVINTELALADLESVDKQLQKVTRMARGGDKDVTTMKALLERLQPHLDEGKLARSLQLDDAEQALVKQLHLLTIKLIMYIVNVDEEGFENNPHLDTVKAIAEEEGAIVVAICNKLESEIAELEDDEKAEFLADLGMEEAGLDRVIRAGYQLLDLQTYFTAGVKEVRAWTIPREI